MEENQKRIRQYVEEQLYNKDIIIWGIGNNAKEFYLNYKEKYKIVACISTQSEHADYLVDQDDGLQILDFSQYRRRENDYIIIFELPYTHCENQLLSRGLVFLQDYVEMYIAEFIASGKKLAIIAGNCQIVTVFDFLKKINRFTDEYYLMRFSTHYWKSCWSLKSLSIMKNMCDLYLCMVHEDHEKVFWRKEELPNSCQIITLPYMMGRIYWPQQKSGWRTIKNEYFIKNADMKGHGPFETGDVNINQMIKEGKSVEEVVELLTSDSFYSKEQVSWHVESVLRLLEFEEQECDVKMTTYIRDRYTEEMLYRDMVHMQPVFVCEYTRQILRYLGMEDGEVDELQKKGIEDPIYKEYSEHCTEVPVYPSVARHMDLKWWNMEYKWDVKFYGGIQKMTFEEYIRAYYDVCSKMKQIMEVW